MSISPEDKVDHLAMSREQRRLELEVLRIAAEWREAIPGRHRDVLLTIELEHKIWELASWHGSLTHLQADLDQELAEYRPAPEPEPVYPMVDERPGDPVSPTQDAELERMGREMAEDPPIWVERTLVDVRDGDMIRMPGQPGTERKVEKASPVLPWRVHPTKDRDAEFHPERHRAEWSEIKVGFVGVVGVLSLKPDMPVEIQMTASELSAIEALGGWVNRTTPAWVHLRTGIHATLACCGLPAMRSHHTTSELTAVTCPGRSKSLTSHPDRVD
jgi:hypothetical protein